MKQASNNEVDLLLQSLARGRDESRSRSASDLGDGAGAFSDHLDADELNSYAEGVVPAPARARYLEHLADCEACRGIVISLTQTAGVAGRLEVQPQEGGSNFWQKLGALFSPTVLRFAVPALVLTAVIGISLLALRQQRRTDLVVQNHEADSEPASSGSSNPSTAFNPAPGPTPSSLPSGTASNLNRESRNENGTLQDQKTQVSQSPPVAVESTVAKPSALKDSVQPGEGAGVATTRGYAPEPKAAAAPPPPMSEEADKSAELAKERPAKSEDQERAGEDVSRSRDEFKKQPNDDDGHGPYRSRSNTAPAVASARSAGALGGRGPSGLDKNKASVVETRSVSGRRFAREDNVWVDTDYDAPRSTIKVARGSEQFRALVADEPGLRAIAEQLSGVVIVVWKNRAYRIQ
jgi:hypothetical protein